MRLLELVHEAESEPACVCKARDPAPQPDVFGVSHICGIKSIENIEDDMNGTVLAELDRFFEPDIKDGEIRHIRGVYAADDPIEALADDRALRIAPLAVDGIVFQFPEGTAGVKSVTNA